MVGADPNSDVALLKINPAGLRLRPLSLGSISSLNGTNSLNSFSIPGAIQTDAAINHGNSGGPLVNAAGAVIGISSQIASSTGGGQGVGFAVPVDIVTRSLAQLRSRGKVAYAYLGVSSVDLFPQLARRLHLGVTHGAGAHPLTVGHDLSDAIAMLARGQVVTLEVWRGGGAHQVKLALGTRPTSTGP